MNLKRKLSELLEGLVMKFKTKNYKLEEILKIKYGKNQKKVIDENGKFPILGTGGLMGYANQYLYDKPSVLIGRKGTIDKIKYIDEPFWTVDTLFYTQIDEELVLPEYIYYYLTTIDFKHYNEGTTIPSLRTETLNRIVVSLPELGIQSSIVKILGNFEKKIKLNNQTIATLEELTSTLFKHWFVDFEFPDEIGNPYKSSGGKMVGSEIGEIPEEWELIQLGNLVTIIDNRGKTPPLEKEKTQYPIIDVKALSGDSNLIDYNKCSKFVNVEIYNNWFRNGHPKENDILLSTVGSIGQMKLFKNNIGAIAQNVVALRSINISSYYLFEYLKFIKQDLVAYNIGSVQPSIKVTHIIKHDILVPNENLISIFDAIVKNIVSCIVEKDREANILTEIRDALLPKLLSGEIELRGLLDEEQ